MNLYGKIHKSYLEKRYYKEDDFFILSVDLNLDVSELLGIKKKLSSHKEFKIIDVRIKETLLKSISLSFGDKEVFDNFYNNVIKKSFFLFNLEKGKKNMLDGINNRIIIIYEKNFLNLVPENDEIKKWSEKKINNIKIIKEKNKVIIVLCEERF